jgi:hypothetical protein
VWVLLTAGACGSDATFSPRGPGAVIDGAWAGTVSLTVQGGTSLSQVRAPISVTITQADGSVTGQFSARDMSGAFTGRVSGNDISGTLTLQGSDGCSATATMQGVLDGRELRLSAPSIGVGTCRWGAQLLMMLTRV